MSALLQRLAVNGQKSLDAICSRGQPYLIRLGSQLRRCLLPGRTTPSPYPHRTISTCQRALRYNKLAFETDKPVLEDILIYSYKKDRFYRLMTIFGIGQFVFWVQLAHFSMTNMSDFVRATQELGKDKEPWWIKYTIGGNTHKNAIALLSMSFGLLALAFCLVYPQRTINSLTLMKGGNGARISVYSYFGQSKTFTVALEDINAMQGRAHKSSNMSMKIRGRRFYYMIDKRDGKFHEPALFDYRVALKRW